MDKKSKMKKQVKRTIFQVQWSEVQCVAMKLPE